MNTPQPNEADAQILAAYQAQRHELNIFVDGIRKWFSENPALTSPTPAIVHSVKARLKSEASLLDKLRRKAAGGTPISAEDCFQRITDWGGVRVLHLHQAQFTFIHAAIMEKVKTARDWVLTEQPRAYTWDPETTSFFAKHELEVKVKESFYTSVHYVVRPREDSPLSCEIQVRTLFEEIWGEVEHSLNYPNKTESTSCREQLMVLSKVVGAGSRLLDSIFRTVEVHTKQSEAVAERN